MPTKSISQLSGRRVSQRLPEDKATDRKGNPRKVPKVGRVHAVVFSPDGRRAVGVQVKQPDIAAMIKRPDVFVALDALQDYGETARKKALYLLEKGWYSDIGSDCHRLKSIQEQYKREILTKDVISLLSF